MKTGVSKLLEAFAANKRYDASLSSLTVRTSGDAPALVTSTTAAGPGGTHKVTVMLTFEGEAPADTTVAAAAPEGFKGGAEEADGAARTFSWTTTPEVDLGDHVVKLTVQVGEGAVTEVPIPVYLP